MDLSSPHPVFEVVGQTVHVRGAPDFLLWRLRDALAFLSPAAEQLGFTAPIEEGEEGGWDGMVRFLRWPKTKPPWFEFGLLPRALQVVASLGLAVEIRDFRRRPPQCEDVPRYLAPIPLRDYQAKAAQACELNAGGVVVASPRSGKTRLLFEVFRRLDRPAIWVAPTTQIVTQTAEAALQWFERPDVLVLGSGVDLSARTTAQARLWIATAAKVLTLEAESCKSRDVVILDEFHHYVKTMAWGRQVHRLFAGAYYWFGATGTYGRTNGDEMALEAVLGTVAYRITSPLLLTAGVLVPTRVAFLPVAGQIKARGVDAYDAGIYGHAGRTELTAWAAAALARAGRKVIVLVSRKEHGEAIRKVILEKALTPDPRAVFAPCEFLFAGKGGDQKRDAAHRKKVIESFLEARAVKILIATQLLGEGVDLPEADALIWARGEAAENSYLQGIFRVVTAAPGKKNAIVVDFVDAHQPALLEASRERWRIVSREPVFTPVKLDGWEDLEPLVRSLA